MRDFIKELYEHQKKLQEQLVGTTEFNSQRMYGSATAAIVEICEMLQSDTRWKATVTGSKKPPVWNIEQFKEEFADVMIYLMNVLVYQNVDIQDIEVAIYEKIKVNNKRFGL